LQSCDATQMQLIGLLTANTQANFMALKNRVGQLFHGSSSTFVGTHNVMFGEVKLAWAFLKRKYVIHSLGLRIRSNRHQRVGRLYL
jgi:hypothetical protein